MFKLLRQRNFGLLWFAGLTSMIGDWVLFIALPIYTYNLTQSSLATGIMFMAGTLPRILLGSVAGVYVDRWDRQRTMVIADLSRAVLLLLLLLVRSAEWIWIIYLVAFLQAIISQFFGPAENALLPQLVDESQLVAANSLNSLNNNPVSAVRRWAVYCSARSDFKMWC
jgi:MFS family permease